MRYGLGISGALLLLGLTGCNSLPWLEQDVILPDGKTIARVMIRAGGEYRVEVENALGSAFHSNLNPIDDGALAANLYLTPENWLVLIDVGGDDAFFDIAPGKPPRAITYMRGVRTRTDSRKWRYIGQVARNGGWNLKYWGPSEKAEQLERSALPR